MGSIRKSWTGQIALGPIEIDVVAKPATGDDKRTSALKRLCDCCHEPFSQSNTCPAGNHPTSAAAEKRGDADLVEAVYGVEADDGSYVVIPQETVDEIEDSTVLDFMQVEETVPVATAEAPEGFPLHLGVKAYFLAYDKDGDPDAAYQVACLHSALAESGDVAVAKWSLKGPQSLVGIHAQGDALMLTIVPFGAQVREPDDLCLKHRLVTVSAADAQATAAFLGSLRSDTFDHDVYEDEAQQMRGKAIDAAFKAAKAKRKQPKVAKAQGKAIGKPKGSMADLLGKSIEQTKATRGGTAKASQAKPKASAASTARKAQSAAKRQSRPKAGAR